MFYERYVGAALFGTTIFHPPHTPHISELVDPTLPAVNPLSTFASKIPESPEEAEAPLKVSNIVGKVLR